jgi:Leucine-rich repeat (LRR) protein
MRDCISDCTNLRVLDLSNNCLTEITSVAKYVKQRNVADDNKTVCRSNDAYLTCRLAKLETLNVNGNYIQYVGDGVQAMTALVELFMADNRLSWLPAALSKLKSLRTLDLAMNNLECVLHW